MNMSQQRQFQTVVSGGNNNNNNYNDNNNNNNNNQYVDTSFTKIFVGGLAWETQRDTMRRYFEQFGEILEAVVITDKHTGRSKGYGFVTFKEAEAAMRACQNPSPVIDGRRANCNLAFLGAQKPPRPPNPHQGRFRSIHAGMVASPPYFHHGSSSSYIHQPSNQYTFSLSPYGYSQDNIYHLPLSYYGGGYGGGYGGHHHQQFSPYYTSGTFGTPGFIPNFYPFYSHGNNQAHGYAVQCPQILHYPYSPHQQIVFSDGSSSGGNSLSSILSTPPTLQSSYQQIVQSGGDGGSDNSSSILFVPSLRLLTPTVTSATTATGLSMTATTTTATTAAITTIDASKTTPEPNSSEQTKP